MSRRKPRPPAGSREIARPSKAKDSSSGTLSEGRRYVRIVLSTTAEGAIMMASGIGVGLILEGEKQLPEGAQPYDMTAIMLAVLLFASATICRFFSDSMRERL